MRRRRTLQRWVVAALTLLTLVACLSDALTPDGLALLEFKNNLIASSVESLANWNESDASPCTWNGINCTSTGYVQNISLTKFGLEGSISPSLGKLKFMEKLDLSGNLLFGSIPTELGNCSALITLHLYNNKNLSGPIPSELGNLQALTEVLLTNNKLNGTIPRAFAALPKLETFDVGENRLTGEVPIEIYENENLAMFYVNDNLLHGNITAGMANTLLAFMALKPILRFGTICYARDNRQLMNHLVFVYRFGSAVQVAQYRRYMDAQ